jgi:acyl-coenzyme A synthetase/AMP-(fatty) acid ligase
MSNPPDHKMTALRACLSDHCDARTARCLHGIDTSIALERLAQGTGFAGHLAALSGRSVLLAVHDQLSAATAMIELDGVARRMVIIPPEVPPEHLSELITIAEVDSIVVDGNSPARSLPGIPLRLPVSAAITPSAANPAPSHTTEWVLLTSGTSGPPKMALHTLASLSAPIKAHQHAGADVVWGTFYDIRRYGGLQIFLRAVLGRGSLILSCADESPSNHLRRLARHGVTHLTGTPSHWRRALMSPLAGSIAPRYVRLSGEIADQAILDPLRSFYPQAAIGHAFASTEAGVAFEVDDGLEGFPATLIGSAGEVELKIEHGSLLIRSARTASRYLSAASPALRNADGFVDTGDMVELRRDRYLFLGRRSGVINVGGLKVHPEEVEIAINRHPAVRMSCVRGRRNPITGALVVADVVLRADPAQPVERNAELKQEILNLCRETLARYKVPTLLDFVPSLDVATNGKIARHGT